MPAPDNSSAGCGSDHSREVVLPMNVNLPESIKVDLPPVVVKLRIPTAWYMASTQQK
jgi:hypothetical protein